MSIATRIALAILLSAGWLTVSAQPAPATHVYDLYQGPAHLGEFGMTFTPSNADSGGGDGVAAVLAGVSESYVTIPGFLDFDATLTLAQDGSALSYGLVGTVQGVAIELNAEFHVAGVSITATQAGQTTSFELASAEPLYVIDNNLIDGLQVLARRATATPGMELDVAIVVPQVVAQGRATARAAEELDEFEHAGTTLSTRRVAIVMTVAGQSVASTVWLDEAGDIVVLEQPDGAVRFVRRTGDAAASGGQNSGESAAPGATGAGAFLASARECVDVTAVTVESTGATLAGLLSLPRADGGAAAEPVPTVLVLPGSGAVDLAGNAAPIIRNSGLEQLAYALGCHGYGVLRIAKLGIPPSTGDGNAVTLDTYARNTADWLALLAAHPGIDGRRLAVLGHSEGGLVALYAAATGSIEPAALLLVATPGRPMDVLLEEQLVARAEESGASAEQVAELRRQVGEAVAAIRASTGTRLELTGDLAENPVAQLFGHAAGLLRTEMEQDPAELIAGIDAPILIVQGAKDMQVRPVDGAALAAAAPGAVLVAPTDMTHNLVDVTGDALEGLVPGPDAVISAALLLAVGTFLDDHLRPTGH